MRNFGALFRDCCQGCQDVLSLPRAIFSQAIADVKQGYKKNPCQASRHAHSCSKPGEPPKLSAGTAMPNFNPSLVRHPPLFAVGPGGLLVRWVLLRLFPLIMSNDSPLQAFSGTDRVTRYPFQFTWFCQRLRLRQCTVPGPWQNSGDTSAAPPFEVHRRSIIV